MKKKIQKNIDGRTFFVDVNYLNQYFFYFQQKFARILGVILSKITKVKKIKVLNYCSTDLRDKKEQMLFPSTASCVRFLRM